MTCFPLVLGKLSCLDRMVNTLVILTYPAYPFELHLPPIAEFKRRLDREVLLRAYKSCPEDETFLCFKQCVLFVSSKVLIYRPFFVRHKSAVENGALCPIHSRWHSHISMMAGTYTSLCTMSIHSQIFLVSGLSVRSSW